MTHESVLARFHSCLSLVSSPRRLLQLGLVLTDRRFGIVNDLQRKIHDASDGLGNCS